MSVAGRYVLCMTSQLSRDYLFHFQPTVFSVNTAFNMTDSTTRYAVFSRALDRHAVLERLLDAQLIHGRFGTYKSAKAIVGWGRRSHSERARQIARRSGLPFFCIEDGFLRSFFTGDQCPPLSIVMDEIGIYFDSTRRNGLESMLQSDTKLLVGREHDVYMARALILEHALSKYNHALRLEQGDLRPDDKWRVLVVDQTFGDMSVVLGRANAETFDAMLQAALAENPGATVYVKTHPEVSAGRKGGYLTAVQDDERVVVLRMPVNPLSLIEQMDRVYVVSSTMGFEALLAGKPVTCFGLPWYAGWGATDDRQRCARRTRTRSVDELFAAAYIHYTRYLNPVTHQRGTLDDVIHWLVRQKEMADAMHGKQRRGRVITVGLRRWKAANLMPMLGLDRRLVLSAPTVPAVEVLAPTPEDTLVFWGATPPAGLPALASASGARLLHMEDGFVRSVGLGSDLIRPLSLVLDRRGIYFDATRESDLEHLLAHRAFSQDDVQRAQAVRAFVVDHGITIYKLEPRQSVQWPRGSKLVVLVPGQVEDDASIRLGCTTIRTNLDLLRAVRTARPDAFIVYKPHPEALTRTGAVSQQEALQWADHTESGVSVVSCIEACDEVHTMTSLTGFDALLRGKTVVTYGQPFYAGWGLTEDRAEMATGLLRRKRRLTLDELVAGALLHYPTYWDWDLKGYTTCEAVLHRIVAQRSAIEANGNGQHARAGYIRRQAKKLRMVLLDWFTAT